MLDLVVGCAALISGNLETETDRVMFKFMLGLLKDAVSTVYFMYY
jgi:hypothetical protein